MNDGRQKHGKRLSAEWWEHYTMPEPNTGCLFWLGTVNQYGYGIISTRGGKGSMGVHRFVYEQARGPIPPDMKVCHRCDNPSCVNLDHLFLGTQRDNLHDMFLKGRARPRGKVPRFFALKPAENVARGARPDPESQLPLSQSSRSGRAG